ncbi:hypothetical protein [Trichormus sp. NMC-1]|nr:hypothetical protein [Trichormus sp. NMC-1]
MLYLPKILMISGLTVLICTVILGQHTHKFPSKIDIPLPAYLPKSQN